MDDRWLSVGEIAEYLGISKDTVYVWITNKGLPGHRIGRFWKFKRSEVDEWVHQGSAADAETEEHDE
jgi:excisionase family DNA binding protein